MKNILNIAATLMAVLPLQAYSLAFSLKTVPLGHPANGDVVKISADYLAVSGHAADGRWLSVIELENYTAQQIALPTQAQFFSSMVLVGHDDNQLVFHTTEGVSHYSLTDNKLTSLLRSPSIYTLPDNKRIRESKMVIDINGDGLSDVLLPDFKAYHLWIQQKDGQFIQNSLAIDAVVEAYEEVPRYTPRKPYLADMNLDGKTDIVFAQDDKLLVFLQRDDGSFVTQPQVRTPGITVSPDSEASLRPGDGRDYSGLVINRFFDFTDLDGDGLADIIIRREVFADALEQNYDYLIHYGRAGESGLHFVNEPDARINTRGIQFESVFADINGDGRKDFYTPSAQFGLGMMVRALISGSAGLEVQFYLMKEDRSFGSRPDHTHKTTASISISGGRVDLPLFQLAGETDVPHKDLWIGEKQQRLIVNRSSEQQLFNKDRVMFSVALPRDGSKARIIDVNGDGKDDLVLPFDAQDKNELRNQVHLLLVQ